MALALGAWELFSCSSTCSADGGAGLIRLAIIGDVHGDWDSSVDGEALQSLGCDAAVFVGDLNNGQPLSMASSYCSYFYSYQGPLPVSADSTCQHSATMWLRDNCLLDST